MKKTIKPLTLCIIHQHPRILLGLKKRGFGMGRWNGFGGKIEKGETIEEAARRELQEEADIHASTMEKHGVILFEFEGNPELLEIHIFKAQNFSGEVSESEEMRPNWFHIDEIPFPEMWPDNAHWLPLFLAGKKFKGTCFMKDNDTILQHTIAQVDEL